MTSLQYRPEIDGLRALAVLPVILFHGGFSFFSGGFVGVDVFFVISGYLITAILIRELERNKFSIGGFYERRARRILPALFLVMTACIPLAWLLFDSSQMVDFSESLIAVNLFASNILFWQESGYFELAAEQKPLLHTWSLSVEEQFYLVFPLFLMVVWKFGFKLIVPTLILVMLASLSLSEWGWRNAPVANFYLAPTRAWELLAGSLTALYVLRQGVLRSDMLSSLGFLLIISSILLFDESTPFPSLYALAPVVGTVLIIMFGAAGTLVAKLLTLNVMVGIGLVSYSAYLWHQPLFAFARVKFIDEPTPGVMLSLSLASIFLAYLTWKYVETPFRNKRTLSLRRLIAILVISFLGLTSFGIAGAFTDGFYQHRQNIEVVAREQRLSKVFESRQREIRAGSCHFNKLGRGTSVDKFLDQWSCYDDDEGLVPSGVFVVGDSHSADKAVAMRSVGLDVFQLGGAGCPLAEELVTAKFPYCEAILRKARKIAEDDRVEAIFLSNRFKVEAVNADTLQAIFDFWRDTEKPVYLWSPMPNFQAQYRHFLRGGSDSSLIAPSYAREEAFYDVLDKLKLPSNFRVIKTSDLWCPSNQQDEVCHAFPEPILMSDADHLGPAGAKILGERIRLSPSFYSIESLKMLHN